MSQPEKSITLTPSWKAFFRGYILGILLIPVIAGIFILWKTIKKHRGYSYFITDRDITVVNGKYSEKVDLADIRNTTLTDIRLGAGTITLKTQGREIEMPGIEHPEQLQKAIDKAIEAELQRLEAEKRTQPAKAKFEPGTLDRLDYLTGLWQQGLISDEDYQGEKKNFE